MSGQDEIARLVAQAEADQVGGEAQAQRGAGPGLSPTLIVTSPFGWRIHPGTGQAQFHGGCDFGLPEGTPIYAPLGGDVQTWEDAVNGRAVAVQGQAVGLGVVRVAFAHLSSLAPDLPARVPGGTLLGWTGKSGNATGPSVHVSTSVNGQPVDPLRVLPFEGFKLEVRS